MMRFVDPAKIALLRPAGWNKKAQAALAYVHGAVADAERAARAAGKTKDQVEREIKAARAKAINSKSRIWAEAGKILRQIMNEKCWYCETRELRSDMPVDHFRPKNNVLECDGKHEGYWWLAFEWTNYRFSCTYCNSQHTSDGSSGGKQDHFPLLHPKKRAWTIGDKLENETPALLDPCDPLDPKVLTFRDDGKAAVALSHNLRRAKTSIRIYHLNQVRLERERKLIAIELCEKVERVRDLDAKKKRTHAETNSLKGVLTEIVRRVESSAPFCTAARCYLRGYRTIPSISEILDRDL